MNTIFGATSTTDQVLEGVDLSGKRVLVTGVSAGLGVETARAFWLRMAPKSSGRRAIWRRHTRPRRQVRAQASNGGSLQLINSIWPRSTACGGVPTAF
jgi:hypothetical protein